MPRVPLNSPRFFIVTWGEWLLCHSSETSNGLTDKVYCDFSKLKKIANMIILY